MSLTYSLEDESFIYVFGSQTVTMADRQILVDQLLSDISLPLSANVLINVCQVNNAPRFDELSLIPILISKLQARFASKRIAVVNNKVGHATVSQLVSMLCDGEVRAFLMEAEARAWISAA